MSDSREFPQSCCPSSTEKNAQHLLSVVMVGEVHKAESSGPAPLVLHHSHAEGPP